MGENSQDISGSGSCIFSTELGGLWVAAEQLLKEQVSTRLPMEIFWSFSVVDSG